MTKFSSHCSNFTDQNNLISLFISLYSIINILAYLNSEEVGRKVTSHELLLDSND